MKQSISKRGLAFSLAIVMLISAIPTFSMRAGAANDKAETAFDVSQYNLTWATPSTEEGDSMPTGNGEIGLNLWTENERDMVFYISKTGAYNNNIKTIKLGKIRVRFPEKTFTSSDFSQTLNLSTGSIEVTSGDLLLEFWIDANAPVIHVRGDSKTARDVKVRYELDWRALTVLDVAPAGNAKTEDVLLPGEGQSLLWYHRNTGSKWASDAAGRHITSSENLALDPVKNLTFGGAIQAAGMTRTDMATLSQANATAVDIKIDIAHLQPEVPQDFVDALNAQKAVTDQVDYAAAYAAHTAWWTSYWDNSYIEITDGTVQKPVRWNGDAADLPYMITQNYLLQRFVQGCSMRGDALVPFNGSIFNVLNANVVNGDVKTPDDRAWDGLPIMWQNTRAPYWATLTSGDYEQAEQLVHYLYKSLPILKEGTMGRFGVEGAYLAEPMDPYGVPADPYQAGHLVYHFTATAEMPLMLVRYYQHTRDLKLFQGEIMPVVEACLAFFANQYAKNDENGKMIMFPANSLESGEYATNPASIIGPLTALLDELLALPGGSLSGAQIRDVIALRNRMPALATRSKNGVDFIAQEKDRQAMMHGVESPELYPVWPSNLYTGYKTEGLDIARQTFAARSKDWNLFGDTGNVDTTGGWNQSTIFSAKLGLPEETGYLLAQCALNCMDRFTYPGMPMYEHGWLASRFPAFWGPNYDWKPDQCHGGNLMTALQAMLLQNDAQGNLYLLSSWPEDWDVNFKLHAPGKTVITGSYLDGSLTYETNNSAASITDMSVAETRIINRVSVACADQNDRFSKAPMPDGKYDETQLEKYILSKDWLETYGFTLNATVGAGYGWNDWGGATYGQEAQMLYLHLTDFDGSITLPLPQGAAVGDTATCLSKPGAAVTFEKTATEMTISMAATDCDPLDTIISIACPAEIIADAGDGVAALINDSDSEIAYTGTWSYVPRGANDYGEYHNDIHQGQGNKGATITYTFEGTGIEALVTKGGGFGSLQIQIDDGAAQTVSLDAGNVVIAQHTAFAQFGLPQGEHTITLTSLATGNQYVTFDAFVVHNSNFEMVNDTDGRIQYGKRDGFTHEYSRGYGEYMDDIHQANKDKATFTYAFVGTGIDVLATKGGNFADYDVSIDGGSVTTVRNHSASVVAQAKVFTREGLEMGHHTIQITQNGGGYTAFDAFKVHKKMATRTRVIDAIETPSAIRVPFGTEYDAIAVLPKTVPAHFTGGTSGEVGVTWQCADYDPISAGAYRVTGTLITSESTQNPKALTASVLIIVQPKPAENVTMLDDTDASVAYTGKWTPQTYSNYGLYQDTQHYTQTKGDSFTFTFTGTGADFISYLDTSRGNCEILLDGVTQGAFNLYRGSAIAQGLAYGARNLPMGEHTIQGVMLSGAYFSPDAFKVYTGAGWRIASVSELASVGAVRGTEPVALPKSVTVQLDDGSVRTLPLRGDWTGDYQKDVDGTYLLRCALTLPEDGSITNDSGFKAGVLVIVSESGLTAPIPLSLTPAALPIAVKDDPYEARFSAVGGTAPYHYAWMGLPTGLSADESGFLSGTPATAGIYEIVLLLRDASKNMLYQAYTLRIDQRFAVLFDGDGATTGQAPTQPDRLPGETFPLPESTFGRPGYGFAGWDDGDCLYLPQQMYTMPAGDVVFTARWHRNSSIANPDKVTTTEKNSDGSNSTIVTDKKTGTVVETAQYRDGAQVVTTTAKDGKATSVVTVSKAGDKTTVTIPTAQKPTAGTVAVMVRADGTKEVIRTSIATADGMKITLTEGASIELLDNSKTFIDVTSTDWYKDAVLFVASRALFNGISESSFAPHAPMTRAMLLTVLCRYDGASTTGTGGSWYADSLAWGKKIGLSDGTNPNGSVTREQLATILYRYAKPTKAAQGDATKFADGGELSDFATEAINWAIASGLMRGKANNQLDPQGNATRAEVAAMLQRFCENTAE